MMSFSYNNKNLSGLELLDILENEIDPFSHAELVEYKGIVTKALIRARGAI
jgi:hypothetical protein